MTQEGGLARADVALTSLRVAIKAVEANFADAAALANQLHKHITGKRAEWLERPAQVVDAVGRKVVAEQSRQERIAAEAKRAAQAEADAAVQAAALRASEDAAKAGTPPEVVEVLKQQARTAQAAPVNTPAAPKLKGSSTVKTWKTRLIGTPADAEPGPLDIGPSGSAPGDVEFSG